MQSTNHLKCCESTYAAAAAATATATAAAAVLNSTM